ncbi:MAG: DUF2058 family protein [Pseudomonadota bacterium]
MSESLQDQLVKAGLASAEQAQKKKRPPARSKNKKRKRRKPAAPRAANGASTAAAATAAGQSAGQSTGQSTGKTPQTQIRRALLQDIREAAKRDRKVLARRTRASLEESRCNDDKATIAHHFVRGKKIKYVYVTAEQQKALHEGTLAVAVYDGATFLVHGNVRKELEASNPDVFFAEVPSDKGDEDEFPVPDDLTW